MLQDGEAVAAFVLRLQPGNRSPKQEAAGQPIEIWFQDEARIGQEEQDHPALGATWTRPSAPHDQRTSSAYIFGAICRCAALPPAWCCRAATPPPWRCIWQRSPGRSNRYAVLLLDEAELAFLRQTRHSRQHHPDAAAAQIARAQSDRNIWAVHARHRALHLDIPILLKDIRPLLPRLEQAGRSAHRLRPSACATGRIGPDQ